MFFFFSSRRRHTRYWRDWSSDVCSSDLAVSISEKCRYGDDVVIIGAGLVGIDAAIGLIHKGVRIHLIEMSDRILPLQLDKKAASKYEELLLKNNVEIITNASVQEAVLDRDGAAQGVVLDRKS